MMCIAKLLTSNYNLEYFYYSLNFWKEAIVYMLSNVMCRNPYKVTILAIQVLTC